MSNQENVSVKSEAVFTFPINTRPFAFSFQTFPQKRTFMVRATVSFY
jgi:hypothetical protein